MTMMITRLVFMFTDLFSPHNHAAMCFGFILMSKRWLTEAKALVLITQPENREAGIQSLDSL